MELYERPIMFANVPKFFDLQALQPGQIYPITDMSRIVIINARTIAMPEWWEAL
jgi:hypothetical protein